MRGNKIILNLELLILSKDSECSRGNSPNTGGKNDNDKNKDRHIYNSQQIHSYPGKKTFKAITHGMTFK